MLERLEQRPAQQEPTREQLALVDALLGSAQREQLARVVPVIEGVVDVDALVALQADQGCPRRRGQRLGDLGLAHAGLALDEERLAELGGEEDGGGQGRVGEVALARERLADRPWCGQWFRQEPAACSSARRVSTRARWLL